MNFSIVYVSGGVFKASYGLIFGCVDLNQEVFNALQNSFGCPNNILNVRYLEVKNADIISLFNNLIKECSKTFFVRPYHTRDMQQIHPQIITIIHELQGSFVNVAKFIKDQTTIKKINTFMVKEKVTFESNYQETPPNSKYEVSSEIDSMNQTETGSKTINKTKVSDHAASNTANNAAGNAAGKAASKAAGKTARKGSGKSSSKTPKKGSGKEINNNNEEIEPEVEEVSDEINEIIELIETKTVDELNSNASECTKPKSKYDKYVKKPEIIDNITIDSDIESLCENDDSDT